MDIEDDDNEMYDDIVCLRQITRRTNWRHRSTSLSQQDVALAATINSSIAFYITFIYILLFQLNSLNNAVSLNRNRQSALYGRLLHALRYYQGLFRFCCYEIDFLIKEEAVLLYLREDQIAPVVTEPPRN
jgi:hypothetical protein